MTAVNRGLTVAEGAALVASMPGIAALHTVEPDGRFTYLTVNERAVEALGRSADDLVGVDITDLFGPGAQTQMSAMLDRALESGGPVPLTTVLPVAEGPLVLDAVVTVYVDDDGQPVQVLWAAVDATGERAAREALARSEARFRSLVDHAFDGVGVLGDDGRYTWVSPSLDRLLGFDVGDLLGEVALDRVHPDDREDAERQLLATVGAEDSGGTWIGRARHRSGEWRVLEVQGTDLRHDPNVGGTVLNVRDVTEQVRAEEALRRSEREYRRQALHDTLTGLPNRALFDDRIRQALFRLDRYGGYVAVLFCDLDGFKWLNDSYGHVVGDQVVVDVGRRIRSAVRESDTVARFGGDEFLILCADLSSPEEALATATRLAGAVRQPLQVSGVELQLTVSIGIATTDRSTEQPDQLIAQADAAMYEAKRSGRNQVCPFDPSLQDRARARVEISAELHRSIAEDRLVVHYQPLVGLADGDLRGVEALVRWSHPERGLLHPADFVSIAEDIGLMPELGGWVMDRACADAMSWTHAPVPVNVNLSARQLADPNLADLVMHTLDRTGLPSARLSLEVTESAVMADVVEAARSLRTLRDLGVRVGIDDFGTGHSSLAYLRQLPLDFLKIDRSFVMPLGENDRDEAIVRAIVEMAHALDLEAVAEGVETAVQHEAVIRLGCDAAQGWHLGHPTPHAPTPSVVHAGDDR